MKRVSHQDGFSTLRRRVDSSAASSSTDDLDLSSTQSIDIDCINGRVSSEEIFAYIQEGKRVVSMEAKALAELADSIDAEFAKVVALFYRLVGRIVVTGVGKSGLIGAKIAATLSSTGSPSFSVHACDAAHGDLGMITPDDAVLAISKSGESKELLEIIHYANHVGIPLIAITQNANSTLGRAARHCLLLPSETPEACGLGVAPTTSSTATLALGDALAVALLKARGFTMADFGALHPGGSLGRLTLRMEDLMHCGDELPICTVSTPVGQALITITRNRMGCVGVVNEAGSLVGIITDNDLSHHMAQSKDGNFLSKSARSIMSRVVAVAHPKHIANIVLKTLKQQNLSSIFVVEPNSNNLPVGIIHIQDLFEQKDKRKER